MAEMPAVKRRRWPYAILGGAVLVGLAAAVWLVFFSRPLAPVEREMVGTWLVSRGNQADFVIELRSDRTFERTERRTTPPGWFVADCGNAPPTSWSWLTTARRSRRGRWSSRL